MSMTTDETPSESMVVSSTSSPGATIPKSSSDWSIENSSSTDDDSIATTVTTVVWWNNWPFTRTSASTCHIPPTPIGSEGNGVDAVVPNCSASSRSPDAVASTSPCLVMSEWVEALSRRSYACSAYEPASPPTVWIV